MRLPGVIHVILKENDPLVNVEDSKISSFLEPLPLSLSLSSGNSAQQNDASDVQTEKGEQFNEPMMS